jgi:hypothetical protein
VTQSPDRQHVTETTTNRLNHRGGRGLASQLECALADWDEIEAIVPKHIVEVARMIHDGLRNNKKGGK